MIIFIIHYKIRRGLGPDWINKLYEVAFDDVDPELSFNDLEDMAKRDFKSYMYKRSVHEREYIITDIQTA